MNLHSKIKRFLIVTSTFTSIVFLGISCEDLENGVHTEARYFIKGEMKYLDVVSGEKKENSGVSVTITYVDRNNFEDGLLRDNSGNSFEFGPLTPGDYELNFRFAIKDQESGEVLTVYEYDTTLTNVNEDIDLDEVLLVATQGLQYFVSGKALFQNPLTNVSSEDLNIDVSLTGEGKNLTSKGSSFRLGPLDSGEYDVSIRLTKENIFANGNTFSFGFDSTVEISTTNFDLGNLVLNKLSGASKFIRGNIGYTDILKNQLGESFLNLTLTLTPIDTSNNQIGSEKTYDINDDFFIVGPLDTGRYQLQIDNTTTDNDFAQSLVYIYDSVHVITSKESDTLSIQPNLTWQSNTALLLQITDSLNNPIPAGVCYFTNPDFLENNLPNCSGSLGDSVSTTSDGRMLIQNLDIRNYFFNASSAVGGILLNNHDSITQTSTGVLISDQLNTHTIRIHKD